MKATRSILVAILISWFFVEQTAAQDAAHGIATITDSMRVLRLENLKSHKVFTLKPGQRFVYQRRSSTVRSEQVMLKSVRDSSLLLVTKKGEINVMYNDLATVWIPKSKENRTAGTVLTVIGGLATLVGVVGLINGTHPDASGVSTAMFSAGIVIGAIGLPLLVGGIALKSDKRYDLTKAWKARSEIALSP